MPISIKFPKTAKSPSKRIAFLMAFKKKTREAHNAKGKEAKDGKISMPTFRKWQHLWYEPRMVAIGIALAEAEFELENDDEFNPDVENDIEEFDGT
jgi:hypothetical protein